MRILVTNDDGIHETGLLHLVQELRGCGHDVIVAGPGAQRSGSAASLGTVEHSAVVPVHRTSLTGAEDVPALTVDGPPALAVRAACSGALGPVPDIVVAGINPGFNAGRLVLHSGTVGAAMTAAALDICGVAVSTESHDSVGFASAAVVAGHVVESLTFAGLPAVALNLNVPNLHAHDLAGVEAGILGGDSISSVTFERVQYGLLVRRSNNRPPFRPATDSDLLSRGFVSLSNVPLPWQPLWDTSGVLRGVRERLRDRVT